MDSRTLGNTGCSLSILGFGGIVVKDVPQPEADASVAAAIEAGITYFDVAPGYGNAQQKLGPALEPYRDGVTLACKTGKRTADEARQELADSLAKLRTDHFDIYQMHGMTTADDFETAMGPGGAIEAFEAAKDQGKARLIGFSAHDEDTALRLIDTGRFDTMLVPLNYVAYTRGGFGPRMLAAANDAGMGVLALKAMARARRAKDEKASYAKCWYHPEDRARVVELLLRFTLSLPGVTAAIPPGDPGLFELAVRTAAETDVTQPLTDAERDELDAALADVQTPIFAGA